MTIKQKIIVALMMKKAYLSALLPWNFSAFFFSFFFTILLGYCHAHAFISFHAFLFADGGAFLLRPLLAFFFQQWLALLHCSFLRDIPIKKGFNNRIWVANIGSQYRSRHFNNNCCSLNFFLDLEKCLKVFVEG